MRGYPLGGVDELDFIARIMGAARARRGEHIQSLWSGYGELFRVVLEGAERSTVIVKSVRPPKGRRSDRSHARKLRSYDVETTFYRRYASECREHSTVPHLLGSADAPGSEARLLVLEDLDAAGFDGRVRRPSPAELELTLAWLAAFHAQFMGVAPEGIWETGTYWHLATRPDELQSMRDEALREAAPLLDGKLSAATFRTFVHGDAKLANFCFAQDRRAVAAVDFQYVGGGCGMKDVAYLLCDPWGNGSSDLERRNLDVYFAHLRRASSRRTTPLDIDAIEAEWRALYPVACADWYRFLAGWAPEHYEGDARARRRVAEVLRQLA